MHEIFVRIWSKYYLEILIMLFGFIQEKWKKFQTCRCQGLTTNMRSWVYLAQCHYMIPIGVVKIGWFHKIYNINCLETIPYAIRKLDFELERVRFEDEATSTSLVELNCLIKHAPSHTLCKKLAFSWACLLYWSHLVLF